MNKAFEESLAKRLAERGEKMDLEISSDHDRLLRAFHDSVYFLAAIAHAFTWTGHAVGKEVFYKFAVDYLSTGDLTSLKRTERFSGRFGPESLSAGLQGWKTIVDQSGVEDILSCDAQGLCMIQENQCLNIASELVMHRQISGVGPWLFCAPFKIVAAHRRELWQSEDLDDLWMPLGLEVVRGVHKLIQDRCTYAHGLDESMLSEEGGLLEGMGTVALVQDMSKRIAQVGRTRVLHVNSGLFLYGRGEL